jgi:hypothetical protein
LLKPHSISAIVATGLFIGAWTLGAYFYTRSPKYLRVGVSAGLIFVAAWYFTLVGFSSLFLSETLWNPRYPLGVVYVGMTDHMRDSGLKYAIQFPRLLIRYQIANTLTVLAVTGPFLLILLLKTLDTVRSPTMASEGDQRASYVFGWLLLGIPLATGVASFFTFTVGMGSAAEALRVHARYYAFLYIITIVAALSIRSWGELLERPLGIPLLRKANGYHLLAVAWPLVIALLWLHNRRFNVWFQDNVETFFLFDIVKPDGTWNPYLTTWHWIFAAILILSPFLYLLRWRQAALLTCLISASSFSIALAQVTRLQHIHSSAVHFRIETGQLIRSVLAGVPDDQILVAGISRYGETAHVLYGLLCACHVRQTEAGQPITQNQIPARVRYVFSVDKVPLSLPGDPIFETPAGVLYKLKAQGNG